jgi:DNA-binding transcriptional LysR family regulator
MFPNLPVLKDCRRILDDLQDARATLSNAALTPRGKLRVSLYFLPSIPEWLAELQTFGIFAAGN